MLVWPGFSTARLKGTPDWNLKKIKQMQSNTLRLKKFLKLFENYSHSSSTLSSKNNNTYSKNEHKYINYESCLAMTMIISIKQHLGSIWSSIHEKVKQHWGWVEKKCCL